MNRDSEIIYLLTQILVTLKAMKKQEKDYWETWKSAKSKEHTIGDIEK